MSFTTYTVPALPYAYNALEPSISAQIMELHHGKHHKAYVDNLNKALQTQATSRSIQDQIALQAAVRFNGGGHINHTLFWENLTPESSPDAQPDAAPKLMSAITATWGSFDNFKKQVGAALLGIQGSGWGWLVRSETGQLRIITMKDQDPVVGADVPILGVDMWEHAYYLQYLNGKAAYVENIWKVINWKTCELRFTQGKEDIFHGLKAAM